MIKRLVTAVIVLSAIACANNNNPVADNSASVSANTDNVPAEGKQLFTVYCANCHNVHKNLIGPALAGVTQRWKDKNDLYKWVHNPQAVIANNSYAKDLFAKWNKVAMTPAPQLKDAQIDAILDYIKAEEQVPQ